MKRNRSEPEPVAVEEELSACPRCGYGEGFHVAFRRRGRELSVFLVCSACGYRFRAGEWSVPTGEPRPRDPSLDDGQ